MNKGIVLGIAILVIGAGFTGTTISLSMNRSKALGFDGNILYVGGNGSGNYSRIQDAIDNASDGDTVSYFFDWGDLDKSGWTAFVPTGTSINKTHKWYLEGTYTIKVKAQDEYGADSHWATKDVNMKSKNRVLYSSYLFRFLERLPLL